MSRPDLTLVREYEAALAWWHAAGVDCDFVDNATAWLADAPLDPPLGKIAGAAQARAGGGADAPTAPPHRTVPLAPAPPPAAPERANLLGDSPPADLTAFGQWWIKAPGLTPAAGFARVPPRGPADAPLMVLVPQPEAEDSERLLSGPQGRLLAAILAAMGLDEDEAYITAALPCHTPMADLPALAASGFDRITLHHIALANPRKLIALGAGLVPMLTPSPDDALREINQTGCMIPFMVSETLDAMMDMPRLKARFWRRWMEWSATV
jgi:DNA polymerase